MFSPQEQTERRRLDLWLRIRELAEQYQLALGDCCAYMVTPIEAKVIRERGWLTDWRTLASLTVVGRTLGISRQQVWQAEMDGLQRLTRRLGIYHRHVTHPAQAASEPPPEPRRRGRRPGSARGSRRRPKKPERKRAIIPCLRCDKRFWSWNIRDNRMCWRCRPKTAYQERRGPMRKTAITPEILALSWAELDRGTATSTLSEALHVGWKRLRGALSQDNPTRLTEVMDRRTAEGAANGGRAGRGTRKAHKRPAPPGVIHLVSPLNHHRQSELDAARRKVVDRHRVRPIEEFTERELGNLLTKVKAYQARHAGLSGDADEHSPSRVMWA